MQSKLHPGSNLFRRPYHSDHDPNVTIVVTIFTHDIIIGRLRRSARITLLDIDLSFAASFSLYRRRTGRDCSLYASRNSPSHQLQCCSLPILHIINHSTVCRESSQQTLVHFVNYSRVILLDGKQRKYTRICLCTFTELFLTFFLLAPEHRLFVRASCPTMV